MGNSGSGMATGGSGIAEWEPVAVAHMHTVTWKLVALKRVTKGP